MSDPELNRRRLLASGALASALVGPAAASIIHQAMPWEPGLADAPDIVTSDKGYLFLNAEEAAFIEAAVDRLIPPDDVGPGAKDAGVAVFIDRQLASAYGKGDHTYLQGPFTAGTKTQGWQMHAPAVAYRTAIPNVNAWARDNKGKVFASLGPGEQDGVLSALEKGDAKLNGDVAGTDFFELLLQNTIEGYFADPIYGGNKDLAAWKMIGFPGSRYDYRDFVDKHGQAFPLPPVGLRGRPDWTRS